MPADYGRLSMFNTIVTLLGFFIGLSTYGYGSVSFFQNKYLDFKKDLTSVIIIHSITFLFFLLLASIISDKVILNLEMTRPLLFFAVLICFSNRIFTILQDILRIKQKVLQYGIWSCLNTLANFILTIVLVIMLKRGWVGKINSQLICSLIFGILSLIFFYRHKLILLDKNWERYKTILIFGIPLIPHLAATWIRQGLDRYIINYNHSTYEVGIFSFALNLASVIIMIGTAFNSTNSVTIYSILGNKDKTVNDKKVLLKKQTREITILTIGISFLFVFLIIPVIHFLLPKYENSIPYFLILSIYGLLQSLYFLYCNYFFYYKDTKKLMYITFFSSLLHLLLSLVLTKYSLYFTVCIYGVVQLVVLVSVIKYGHRLLNRNLF